jgi:hypothetical protein
MESFNQIHNKNINIVLEDIYRSFSNFFNFKEIIKNPHIFYPLSKYDIKTNKYAIIRLGLYSSFCIGILTNNWKLIIMIFVLIIIIGIIVQKLILSKKKKSKKQIS